MAELKARVSTIPSATISLPHESEKERGPLVASWPVHYDSSRPYVFGRAGGNDGGRGITARSGGTGRHDLQPLEILDLEDGMRE